MGPTRWQKIGELFAAARLLKADEQQQFLSAQCNGDETLAEEIASLLRADDKTGPLDETVVSNGLGLGGVFAERFRLLRHVGRGGMGDVFEAEDLQLRERVALKTIRPEIASDALAIERFRREIYLAKKVTHRNVCRIYDLGVHRPKSGPEILFVTMEFLDGETLATRLRRGPLAEPEALALFEDMTGALAAAHMAEVAHRDFKSSNVILVPGTERERAIVTDFGLACAVQKKPEEGSLLSEQGVMGTLAYMAPEQVKGTGAGKSADIYSLGVVMYEAVTGRCPFESDSAVSIALKHLTEEPIRPRKLTPGLNPKIEDIILRCLRKSPEERFASVEAISLALADADVKRGRSVLTRRKTKKTLLLAAVIATLALVWAAVQFFSRFQSSSQPRRVAVLTFENIGADKSNEAFCQGLRETLTSKLTQLEQFQGALSVVPTSELRLERVKTASDAQRDFGVNLVVTGSVQRTTAGVRVITNLVDARKLRQLASKDTFVLNDELPVMQDAVLNDVTDLLDVELEPRARQLLAQGGTSSPGAYGYYLQGYGYLHSGHVMIDPAITEFQHALQEDSNYSLAYAGLGEAYWRKYQSSKDQHWVVQAWAECRRAVAINSHIAPPHTTLAMLYVGTGKFDEAISEANIALSIDSRNRDAYLQKAQALEALGRLPEAERVIRKTISLRPDSWEGYFQLGSFYKKYGRYKDAEAPFQRIIDLVPDNSIGYANLGDIYYLEGLDKKAEELYVTSLNLKATPGTYSNLATLYFFQGRFDEAAAIYERQATADETEYTIWGNLGDAYRWSTNSKSKAASAYSRAIRLAKQALEVNPKDSDALSSLGLYCAKSNRLRQALQYTERAVKLAPEDKDVLFAAAVTFELEGRRQRALRILEKANKSGYSRSEILREPELRGLRRDAGFKSLLAASGSK